MKGVAMELFWIMTLQWTMHGPETTSGCFWVDDEQDERDVYYEAFAEACKKLKVPEGYEERAAVLFYSVKPLSRRRPRNV
jgi:hypothetical protein